MIQHRLTDGLDDQPGPDGLWGGKLVEDLYPVPTISQERGCGQPTDTGPRDGDLDAFCHGVVCGGDGLALQCVNVTCRIMAGDCACRGVGASGGSFSAKMKGKWCFTLLGLAPISAVMLRQMIISIICPAV